MRTARSRLRAAAPPDRKAVGIAHVDVSDVAGALCDDLRGDLHEGVEALVDLLAAEPHRDTVVEIEFPGAPGIETQRRHAHADLREPALHRQIALGDSGLGAIRTAESWKLEGNVAHIAREERTARVDETARAPACRRDLLDDVDREPARPAALDGGGIDPWQPLDCRGYLWKAHADETRTVEARLHRA